MRRDKPGLISFVLPVFNEAQVLDRLHLELDAALKLAGVVGEMIYVDDGSTDVTASKLDQLAMLDRRVTVLHLSRNFGQQSALLAGLRESRGDVAVIMDSDLQDDPAALPRLLEAWRQGADVVYAIRVRRKEGIVQRLLFAAFYRALNMISQTPIPRDAGNFSLVDKRVAREICELLGQDRYFPGVRRWVGFRQVGVEVERQARYDGVSRVRMIGLWRLAKTAIFAFSAFPLTLFYGCALLASLVFMGLTVFTLYHKLWSGLAIPGWTSQIMTACFFGAINSLGIAIVGEYLSRIYEQVRKRPTYIVDRRVSANDSENENENVNEAP